MKRLSQSILTVFMAVLMGLLPTVRVFAAETELPDYIIEAKVFMGDYSAAEAEGFTLLKVGNAPVDLNQNAGGGLGSKGEKAVYLGYKTTKNRSEAITDLALMNMKGGYDVAEYEALMKKQLTGQIIPMVDNFLAAIEEYRANYRSENENNRQRAQYIHDVLNKFIDDDTGKGLGDLLLNETVYEMAKSRFDALSEEEKERTSVYDVNVQVRETLPVPEKNKHADILTIIAQSNGKATLLIQNLITRAADTNDNNWLERFAALDYDKLEESTGLSPTDAEKELAKLFDDDASLILERWDSFREELLNYDEALKTVNNYEDANLEAVANELTDMDENTNREKVNATTDKFCEAEIKKLTAIEAAEIVAIHDMLEDTEYDDGDMLSFFTQPYEDVADDITVLYPLIASFTEGQRAGLEFVSLKEMIIIAMTDAAGYNSAELDEMKEVSIYDGVDRGIYQKGGVALTNDALRKDALAKAQEDDNGIFSPLSIALMAVTAASFAAVAGSAAFMAYSIKMEKATVHHFVQYNRELMLGREIRIMPDTQAGYNLWSKHYDNIALGKKLCVGFTIATIIIAGVTTYLTWQEMKAYYNVEFSPIPHYMVDEKDIIGYNKKGEKVVLKNQSAYYKAVECNRSESAEFFGVLGTCADMNGDVGKQWLALYVVKNELMDPILASSLKAVVGSTQIPAGYQTGIHMFGTEAAFNLNSSLYDWNNDAPSVYVYFNTDDTADAAGAVGANFTGGMMALSGGTGIAIGAAFSALAMKTKRKSDKKKDGGKQATDRFVNNTGKD